MCCRERLREIVFDKIEILSSEPALNCTNTLCLDEVSKYFVWSDPRLVQVALVFHTLIVVHRVHCCEKQFACSFFGTPSSWDQSTSDYWMHFTYFSDVVDVLGRVLRQQYIVLQCRINEITSWKSLNCSEIQEVFRRVRVQNQIETFSLILLTLHEKISHR